MDIGPLARLKEVLADPSTMGVLVQRLAEGESLREIATAWRVPYGRLFDWISQDVSRAEQYLNALRCVAASDVHEIVPIADASTKDTVAVHKLMVHARVTRAQMLDPRYRQAALVNVEVKQDLSLLDREQRVLEVARTVEWLGALDGDIKRRHAEQGLLEAPLVEKVVTPEKEERNVGTDTSDI